MYMATQYDGSQFPNLRIAAADGREEILKFDRILADVPCSGDGTLRKNQIIWRSWTEKSGKGLHPLQIRIAFRGLQMLAVDGQMVYSTCSLNPIENEAVIAEILRLASGAVEVVDVSQELPELKRRPGMQSWKVFDSNSEEMERTEVTPGEKILETMFPPTSDEEDIKSQLSRCIRVYPHLQDTGGFFITLLKKKAHLGGRKVNLPEIQNNDEYPLLTAPLTTSDDIKEPVTKKLKPDNSQPDFGLNASQNGPPSGGKEEPFVYLPQDHPEIEEIRKFYSLAESFPTTDLFVRNASGEPIRAIFITNPFVKQVLHHNPSIRVLNAGTRLFVKQPDPK